MTTTLTTDTPATLTTNEITAALYLAHAPVGHRMNPAAIADLVRVSLAASGRAAITALDLAAARASRVLADPDATPAQVSAAKRAYRRAYPNEPRRSRCLLAALDLRMSLRAAATSAGEVA